MTHPIPTDQGASASADRAATPSEPSQSSVVSGVAGIPCAFTPGPWKVGGEWPQMFAVYDSRLVYIAHANTGIGSDWIAENPLGRGVAKANANLIAAAPDLYAALGKLMGTSELNDENREAMAEAAAVRRRVRGEQVPA